MKKLLFAAALALVVWKHDRLKHLAVPVLTRPAELPAAAPKAITEGAPLELKPVASLGTRVTALLTASDGALWAGTFDRGVFRGERQLDGQGRQHFVNALVEHRGAVYAATYAGVLEYRLDGTLARVHLPGVATEALVVHGGALVAGTVSGLYRDFALERSGLRVTALTVSRGALWVGTPSGVYEARGAWHPLVFGPEASSTNVVLALAPWGDGVVALTDDGGLVEVQPGREVRARRFLEARANEGNPGAALVVSGSAWFGTQGGGLLALNAAGAVSRPKGWAVPVVTALAPGLLGDGAGNVYRLGG